MYFKRNQLLIWTLSIACFFTTLLKASILQTPTQSITLKFVDALSLVDSLNIGFYFDPNYGNANSIVSTSVDSSFGEKNQPVLDSTFSVRSVILKSDSVLGKLIPYDLFLKKDIRYSDTHCAGVDLSETDSGKTWVFRVKIYNGQLPIKMKGVQYSQNVLCLPEDEYGRVWFFQIKTTSKTDTIIPVSDVTNDTNLELLINATEFYLTIKQMNWVKNKALTPFIHYVATNNSIQIASTAISTVRTLKIYNMQGVMLEYYNQCPLSGVLRLSEYSTGVYILLIQLENGSYTYFKFFKP